MSPPKAPRRPETRTLHGRTTTDDYAWLRNREDPDTLAYLRAENEYADAMLAHTLPLQERLFTEFRSRIQETDTSVMVPDGGHLYYTRTVEGLQYDINCRCTGSPDAPEQVVLDENQLAHGHDYFALGCYDPSPDHRLLVYSTDTTGEEVYSMRVRDMRRLQDHPDVLGYTYGGVAWASDNRTFFYTTLDDANRPYRVWRHVLGTAQADDVLVHQEDDESFFVFVGRTRSGAFVAMHIGSMTTSEVRFADAARPDQDFEILEPRRHEVEYFIDHSGDDFYIVTNDEAVNYRCVAAPVASPGRANWREVVAPGDDVRIETLAAFKDHVVLQERAEASTRLRVRRLVDGADHLITHEEDVRTVHLMDNPAFDTASVMFSYTSLTTPRTYYAYDMETHQPTVLKQQPVLSGYDRTNYVTERVWADAADGTAIPTSVVRRADTPLDGTAPCLVYAYGAYGVSTDPAFSPFVLSLLDRGFVYALAHPRGGGDLGKPWHDAGKMRNKPNTFSDVIACARALHDGGYSAPNLMALRGASAGGLMVGGVLAQAADLFACAVAEVPFVDCVNTLLDASLPLTVTEWEEWGNPQDPDDYDVIASYSPCETVTGSPLPSLLVTAGLTDPRVGFWEPAKWVAKLRAARTDDAPLLLRTEMDSGHAGPSGRYDAWRDEARVFAFVIDALGVERPR